MDKSWANCVQNFNESSQYSRSCSWSLYFWFYEILSCFVSFMTKIFYFTIISLLPIGMMRRVFYHCAAATGQGLLCIRSTLICSFGRLRRREKSSITLTPDGHLRRAIVPPSVLRRVRRLLLRERHQVGRARSFVPKSLPSL